MQSRSENGFVKAKERVPYHGKGIDELVASLRQILIDPTNKYTQKIVLEVGAPHIYIEKLVPESSVDLIPTLSIHDAIRTHRMVEYEGYGDKLTPLQTLWEMFSLVHAENLEVGFLVVGDKAKFQKWLGVRIPANDLRIFGITLQVCGELPPDVFVVCGTAMRVAEIEDIQFSLKGTL